MDELDKFISSIVEKEISEPIRYEETIKNALKEKTRKIKFNNITQKIAIIIASITTIGGVVFASNFFIKNNTPNIPNSIYEDNEYAQYLNTDFTKIDNLSIRIESIMFDSFNIQLVFDYLYPESFTSVEAEIFITDENNNIIFNNYDINTGNYFENRFQKQNRHKYGDAETNTENTDNSTKFDTTMITQYTDGKDYLYNNNFKKLLSLYTDLDLGKFPNSKKLYVKLSNITVKNDTKVIAKLEKECNFEIDVDKQISDRKISTYIKKNMNDKENFKVLAAQLSDIQFKVKIVYIGDQNFNQISKDLSSDNIQLFDEKNNNQFSPKFIHLDENNIIKLDFNINANTIADRLILKIGNLDEIELIKY